MSTDQKEIFSIRSETDYVNFRIDTVHGFPNTTFFMGGYDSECEIEVFSDNFFVKAVVYISTAQFYEFYSHLKLGFETLNGNAKIGSYENDFYTEVIFDGLGHASIQGVFSKGNNELKFDFETDQTFMGQTLKNLSVIVDKYGDNLGTKNYPQ